jgi:DNA repair protein RadC
MTRNDLRRKKDVEIIAQASRILERWFLRESEPIYCAQDAAPLLQVKLAGLDREVFAALFLDARHRALAFEIMFYGTVAGVVSYPREIARAALKHNAVAVIVAHNHPSGNPEPSRVDEDITDRLRQALALLDIKLLDHIVVAGAKCTSIEERRELAAALKMPWRKKHRTRAARTTRKAA